MANCGGNHPRATKRCVSSVTPPLAYPTQTNLHEGIGRVCVFRDGPLLPSRSAAQTSGIPRPLVIFIFLLFLRSLFPFPQDFRFVVASHVFHSFFRQDMPNREGPIYGGERDWEPCVPICALAGYITQPVCQLIPFQYIKLTFKNTKTPSSRMGPLHCP